MFDVFRNIKRVFRLLYPAIPSESTEATQQGLIKEVVMHFARGNLTLQEGRYLTKEDMQQARDSLRHYRFSR
ncbi:MAG: hypothetical protein HQM06_07010 [Magnetococcales bacterium]|nr:hypothetical protein [Magnetococcales bacterium]